MASEAKLKIKPMFINTQPHWEVYQMRKRKWLWFEWQDWSYLTLVPSDSWDRFLTEFSKLYDQVEVSRGD